MCVEIWFPFRISQSLAFLQHPKIPFSQTSWFILPIILRLLNYCNIYGGKDSEGDLGIEECYLNFRSHISQLCDYGEITLSLSPSHHHMKNENGGILNQISQAYTQIYQLLIHWILLLEGPDTLVAQDLYIQTTLGTKVLTSDMGWVHTLETFLFDDVSAVGVVRF